MRAIAAIALLISLSQPAEAASRIKDVTDVQGIRDNQLVGYGLVIGLPGSGDSLRNSPFTEQSARSMLMRMGVGVPPGSIRSKNIAAVVVTATLPPFVSTGTKIDVTVSSLGDASSLRGGTLVLTPLVAADGQAYAVAQGPVTVGGFSAAGDAEKLTQGVPTSGRIAGGAIIERELTAEFNSAAELSLQVRNPDFATTAAVAKAINEFARQRYKSAIASAVDHRTVLVHRPKDVTASLLMAEIGSLEIDADTPARIVIDEKTGTIVIGSAVRILPVAVTHGNLTVKITEMPDVSQPEPFSDGDTVVIPSTVIDAASGDGKIAVLEGPTLDKLVEGLNRMGLEPDGIIAILQTIKSAGALEAELVVQ